MEVLQKEVSKLRTKLSEREREIDALKQQVKGKTASKAVVVYDFAGDPAGRQLRLRKGEVLHIRDTHESGWWTGETPDGEVGFFPSGYVTVVE